MASLSSFGEGSKAVACSDVELTEPPLVWTRKSALPISAVWRGEPYASGSEVAPGTAHGKLNHLGRLYHQGAFLACH